MSLVQIRAPGSNSPVRHFSTDTVLPRLQTIKSGLIVLFGNGCNPSVIPIQLANRSLHGRQLDIDGLHLFCR